MNKSKTQRQEPENFTVIIGGVPIVVEAVSLNEAIKKAQAIAQKDGDGS